ncbi:GYD family protein [halophilic archaeon DL31]|jgi:uncharacterized protein with GYD domain|nr:GYD family protein [halophilic archaeon DL31]
MQRYVILVTYTNAGIKDMKNSPERLEKAIEVTEAHGGEFISFNMTMGRYDAVFIADFPDDQAAATAVLTIGSGGAVQSETLKALSDAEYHAICEALP